MATLRVPDVVPSPQQDCERLHKAFKGFGTDEESVIWVLGHRDSFQRKNIRETYQQLYKKSLIDVLYSELSGDFMKAIIMWTTDPPERDAKIVRDALTSKKKDSERLQIVVEIACSSSPHHLLAVRKAYCSLFDCSLEEDIVSNISPPLQKNLLGFVSSYRYDKEAVDMGMAKSEADKLNQAIKAKQFDHDDFVFILYTRNFYQLRATFECYQQNYGNFIDEDIKSCGDDELRALLKVAIQCIDVPERHYAEVIKKSLTGIGTDEKALTRVIVTRAEIDMMKIRGEYFNMYNTNLDGAVTGDTSGDYKAFLMTLLGARI